MLSTLTPQQASLFHQLPGYWGCKDTQSVFVYANDAYAKLIGHQCGADCIGLTDFDMPAPTTKCAADFREQDRYVIETGQSLRVLDIHPFPDGSWRALIFSKSPWLNAQGDIQGTIFYGQELTDTAIIEVGHWIYRAVGLNQSDERISLNHPHVRTIAPLTNRESEALFLLLYGKKPKQISAVMGISIKTFEGYVDRLRQKFAAHSKDQLIDKALELGYGSYIPQTLLKTQLSVVLNNQNTAQ